MSQAFLKNTPIIKIIAYVYRYSFQTLFRCKKRRILLFVVALICSFYLVSPYMTLWSITQALQEHNTKQLEKNINWRALKHSLKNQIISDVQDQKKNSSESNDLPDFGASFASAAISNGIDKEVNAANFKNLMDQLTPETSDPIVLNYPKALKILYTTRAFFSSFTTFDADIILPNSDNKTILHMEMKFEKWHWKITTIKTLNHISKLTLKPQIAMTN